jgi:hypothetical protein
MPKHCNVEFGAWPCPTCAHSPRYVPLGGGIYRDTRTDALYERPRVNGRPTWRKLQSRTLKAARDEIARNRVAQIDARLGRAEDPYQPAGAAIGHLLEEYRAAIARASTPAAVKERNRLDKLAWWKNLRTEQINRGNCSAYAAFRRSQIRSRRPNVNGGRAVDLELNTLAHVTKWAADNSLIGSDPFKARDFSKPTFTDKKAVRHCREVAPLSAEEAHAHAAALFESRRTEADGWQYIFELLTGCRGGEVLRWRMDATRTEHPGFISGNYLFLARAKGGVNPFALIHPALKKAIKAHRIWHKERFPKSVWWFPSYRTAGKTPLTAGALAKVLARIAPLICGSHRTPHGARSFYVTVRRSQGVADGVIAAEIGDKTGAPIIAQTYGAIPPNWQGGKALTFLPRKGSPAWAGLLESLKQPANVRRVHFSRLERGRKNAQVAALGE